VKASAGIKQQTDRLEKHAEKQLKERIEEFKQRQHDRQDLKDVRYNPAMAKRARQ
jgi:hypothetical protein